MILPNGRKGKVWISTIAVLFALAAVLLAAANISSAAAEITYKETDLVKVVPEAVDPDGDNITFVFSEPLNQSGEWQTGYEDAGVYNITVAAFDGRSYSEEPVTLIIKDKNQPPEIIPMNITVKEGEVAVIKPKIVDPDGDITAYIISAPFNSSGEWQTGYEDAGAYSAYIAASDGEFETIKNFSVIVENKNRAPLIDEMVPESGSLGIDEAETLNFSVQASDPDSDKLDYTWFLDDAEAGIGNEFTYLTDYEDAGQHSVRVDISDGYDVASYKWDVLVDNVNRAPNLTVVMDQTIDEDTELSLELPEFDADGDKLEYSIDDPIGDDGNWTPSYDDAGYYEVNILVTDGKLTDEKAIAVEVKDVDRAPEFEPIDDIIIDEESRLLLALNAADPDGDDVNFTVAGFPESAKFRGDAIDWEPGYDYVSLPNNTFARLTSRLRITNWFYLDQKVFPATIKACGKDKCTEQRIKVTVLNVNRAPILKMPQYIEVNEGEEAAINLTVSDPDGDYVSVEYSGNFSKKGRWQTGFDDAGEYDILVTAYDGDKTVEDEAVVAVNEVNREPQFLKLSDQVVKENETLSFGVRVNDPDNESIELWAEDMPEGAAFAEGVFEWMPGFDVASKANETVNYEVTFGATDGGNVTIKKVVTITVKNVNLAPVLTMLSPAQTVNATLGQKVVFRADAFDADSDTLSYNWNFGMLDNVKGKAVARTFIDSGMKKVKLTVSDGDKENEYTWFVDVAAKRVVKKAVKPVQNVTKPIAPKATFVTYTVNK